MLRGLATLSLAALLVLALAWPLSIPGLELTARGVGDARTLALATGAMWYSSTPELNPTPFDRPTYSAAIANQFPDAVAPPAGPGVVIRRVPFVWPGLGAAIVFAASTLALLVRARARRIRSLCLACGHPRHQAEGPCTECGALPAEARLRTHARLTAIPRDAALLAFLAPLAASLAVWGVFTAERSSQAHARALANDYSWYADLTTPRLTGGLAVSDPASFGQALDSSASLIVLLPGNYKPAGARRGARSPLPSDRWLIGSGPDSTVTQFRGDAVQGLRLENLAVDCDNDPFLDARNLATASFRNCRFFNYNSGAGGSNAIYAQDCALLFEHCEFEGRSGRRNSFGGNALDLRGDSRIFLRDCRLVDNQELARNFRGVIDRCNVTVAGDEGRNRFFPPYSEFLARDFMLPGRLKSANSGPAPMPPVGRTFTEALDDPGPLAKLHGGAGVNAYTDPVARALARDLNVDHDREFWRRLLLSSNPETRALAADALHLAPAALPSVEDALTRLDQPVVPFPDAAALLADPAKSRPALETLASSAPPQIQTNARGLLQLLAYEFPLADALRAEAARPPLNPSQIRVRSAITVPPSDPRLRRPANPANPPAK